MNTRLATLVLVLAVAAFSASLAGPAAAARVHVKAGPPAVRVEVRGLAPSPRHVWRDGYWRRDGRAHAWAAGTRVVPPRPGAAWIPGRWKSTPGGWYWIEGHWKK